LDYFDSMNSEKEISNLLEDSNLSVTEISFRAGLSRATIYDVRKGKFRLKPESLERLLLALEVPGEQIRYLIEKTIEERMEDRMSKPGTKVSDKEATVFATELADRIGDLGILVSSKDENVDFVLSLGREKIPVIVKISVVQPERFFASIMAAKLEYGSSWAVIVTPFPPAPHRYEKLFDHHRIEWTDGQGLLKLTKNKNG
jgi:transcriptional regulator with XRE-family HTH domain